MKKVLLFTTFVVFSFVFVILTSSFSNDFKSPSGSPGKKTGSPLDASNCTSCHGGTATTVTGIITTNIPEAGYTAGQTYAITVTLNGASEKKGFELTAENATSKIGTFAAGTGTKLTNANSAVTHSAAITTAIATWTFNWTAPASGSGIVTFYAACVIAKANTKLTSIQVSEAAASISETQKTEISIYPNPAIDKLYLSENNLINASVQIYSLEGKIIVSQEINNNEIDVNQLEKGIYIIKILDNNNFISTKIFVKI